MMPENLHSSNPPSAVSGIHSWNSPLPYLFGGLAVMLGLIALALIFLVCSYKKSSTTTDEEQQQRSSSSSSSHEDDVAEQKSPKLVLQNSELMEQRIVVIMAGDRNPTYLAKPVVSEIRHTEEV